MNELKKIKSFTIDHNLLVPGIYVSRKDTFGTGKNKTVITTFDIRVKRPNYENAMCSAESHTIEHLGATYFRNLDAWKDKIVYFGPMGCLTGFYLILEGDYEPNTSDFKNVVHIVMDMFKFVVEFSGKIPGSEPSECGNCKLHDLDGAKNIAGNMLVFYETFGCLCFEYPTDEYKENKIDDTIIDVSKSQVCDSSTLKPINRQSAIEKVKNMKIVIDALF